MGELRQNLLTKRWVIVAPDRAQRPHELVSEPKPHIIDAPAWDAGCPFCPGNEESDLEVARLPRQDPWQVRIVRNRYPALQLEGEVVRSYDGTHRSISAVGYHDVIVESPRHNACHALGTPKDVAMVVQAFLQRGQTVAEDDRMRQLVFFKNHGEGAGTSIIHPHSQMIALPMVPHSIRERAEQARRHYDDFGRCVFCHMLNDEVADGRRLILESTHFLAFIPYAAYSPFHCWIIPRRHESSFLRISEAEVTDLGYVLHTLLRKLYFGLRDPDFNYIIRTAPLRR